MADPVFLHMFVNIPNMDFKLPLIAHEMTRSLAKHSLDKMSLTHWLTCSQVKAHTQVSGVWFDLCTKLKNMVHLSTKEKNHKYHDWKFFYKDNRPKEMFNRPV